MLLCIIKNTHKIIVKKLNIDIENEYDKNRKLFAL